VAGSCEHGNEPSIS